MSALRLFSKFVTSKDGTQIFAEATAESPSDSKPTIIFVHGFSCSGASWDCLFASAQLQERFYMVNFWMHSMHGVD
jgi:pimeloyl-ACP methyl ester carboxylesterase